MHCVKGSILSQQPSQDPATAENHRGLSTVGLFQGQDSCNNTKICQPQNPVTTANSGRLSTGGLFQTAWSRLPQKSTLLMDLSKQSHLGSQDQNPATKTTVNGSSIDVPSQ